VGKKKDEKQGGHLKSGRKKGGGWLTERGILIGGKGHGRNAGSNVGRENYELKLQFCEPEPEEGLWAVSRKYTE